MSWSEFNEEDYAEFIRGEEFEKWIQILVEAVKELEGTKDMAIKKIIDKYPDYKEKASQLVDEFWK